jgi:hypothetical protein
MIRPGMTETKERQMPPHTTTPPGVLMSNYLKIGASMLLLVASSAALAQKNTPPTVSLTSPTANQSFVPPATVTLTATAADANGTVSKVDFYRGSTTLIGTSTTPPYSYTWSNVAAGSYALTAKATDNAGAVTTSSAVSITVAAPKISIDSPLPGAAVLDTNVNVRGTFVGDANTTVLHGTGEQWQQYAACRIEREHVFGLYPCLPWTEYGRHPGRTYRSYFRCCQHIVHRINAPLRRSHFPHCPSI